MKELELWTLEDSAIWDALVRSFANYDVYYLSGYVKAFQLHGDGEPLLFSYEGEGLRGIHVVMRRDIATDPHFAGQLAENAYFDVATPYGYGGWLIEGDGDRVPLYTAYQDWCREHSVVSEFVRFSLYSNTRTDYYGEVVPRTNNIVRSLDIPLDQMLMDFEHKVRKNLKKAESAGLTIEVDTDGRRLSDFLEIYYATMDRNEAEDAYYFKEDFYRQINQLTDNYAYFHVLLDEKVIATELVIMGSDTMYSYLGGTKADYFADRPNDFLKYHIIRWGLENNYKRFVLGGGYGADDGIFRYKKSFAPNGVVRFYTGQAVFDTEAYEQLIRMRNPVPFSSFFPQYRAKE